jgi:hypothetical protein
VDKYERGELSREVGKDASGREGKTIRRASEETIPEVEFDEAKRVGERKTARRPTTSRQASCWR